MLLNNKMDKGRLICGKAVSLPFFDKLYNMDKILPEITVKIVIRYAAQT